jgi:hypothetical protein
MLRRANRLQEHLKSIGYGFYERSVYPENPLFDVREVEFIPAREGENRKRNRGSPDGNKSFSDSPRTCFIPAGFSFWTLERLIRRVDLAQDEQPFFIPLENVGWRQERWGDDIPRFRNWWREDESINIFWVSSTEFVSPLRLHSFENYASYKAEFAFNEKCTWSSKHSSLFLYAYHLENIKNKGRVARGSPEAPLQFFKQLVAPVVDRISSIQFSQCEYGLSRSSVLTMLSLIPTHELGHRALMDGRNDVLRVKLYCDLTDEQVEEFVSFPFHPMVRLAFSSSCSIECSRCLLRAKHLRHAEIPDKDIDGNDTLFGSNPVLQSLTFRVGSKTPPRKFLESIAESTTIKQLTVQCYGIYDEHRSRILDILRSGCVRRHSSVTEFTIELTVGSFQNRSGVTVDAQRFFDQWTPCICSDSSKWLARHFGLCSFRFAFSDGRFDPFIESNLQWDSFIVPSLAMNWYQQQRRGEPSPSEIDEICIMERAVRAVSQGSAYRGATNVAPFDLSPSSASVIFDMLVRNAASIVKRQPVA